MTSKTGEDPGSEPQALPLDEVDRAIVAVLREDGRISMRALAARLHISRAGAYLRVLLFHGHIRLPHMSHPALSQARAIYVANAGHGWAPTLARLYHVATEPVKPRLTASAGSSGADAPS